MLHCACPSVDTCLHMHVRACPCRHVLACMSLHACLSMHLCACMRKNTCTQNNSLHVCIRIRPYVCNCTCVSVHRATDHVASEQMPRKDVCKRERPPCTAASHKGVTTRGKAFVNDFPTRRRSAFKKKQGKRISHVNNNTCT